MKPYLLISEISRFQVPRTAAGRRLILISSFWITIRSLCAMSTFNNPAEHDLIRIIILVDSSILHCSTRMCLVITYYTHLNKEGWMCTSLIASVIQHYWMLVKTMPEAHCILIMLNEILRISRIS